MQDIYKSSRMFTWFSNFSQHNTKVKTGWQTCTAVYLKWHSHVIVVTRHRLMKWFDALCTDQSFRMLHQELDFVLLCKCRSNVDRGARHMLCPWVFWSHAFSSSSSILTHSSQPSSFCSPAGRCWASAPCTRAWCPPWQPASSEGSSMPGRYALGAPLACAAPSPRSAWGEVRGAAC